MDSAELPDFSGKIVLIQQPGKWRSSVLTAPTFQRQGGRLFLVGKLYYPAGEGQSWANEAIIAIPWRRVAYYMVFKSAEAYDEAIKAWEREKPRRGWFGKEKPA